MATLGKETMYHRNSVYRVVGDFTAAAGKDVKIETSPAGEDVFEDTVPAGKQWNVSVKLIITETDV